ncbi:hypothetical protein GCM10010274_65670 [Streptomyces lavendofoliae]|uniref:Uncharacterized protein n=1 Tax=Streptomyces lavendofoliae TaxID=67314 RepID=A0A918I513_9ACTN|nr:hypothetical protein GCM10010274_65670 [Streptomyces lavendofoliae]
MLNLMLKGLARTRRPVRGNSNGRCARHAFGGIRPSHASADDPSRQDPAAHGCHRAPPGRKTARVGPSVPPGRDEARAANRAGSARSGRNPPGFKIIGGA